MDIAVILFDGVLMELYSNEVLLKCIYIRDISEKMKIFSSYRAFTIQFTTVSDPRADIYSIDSVLSLLFACELYANCLRYF